jgi:rsbT co-antagonist protein RsbR
MTPDNSVLPSILQKQQAEVLQAWLQTQLAATTLRPDLLAEGELREQSREFLELLSNSLRAGGGNFDGAAWQPTRDYLSRLSESRGTQGFTPSETATFILSLKQPLFSGLRNALSNDAPKLADEMWRTTVLLDQLALHTMDVFLLARERTIARQQEDMLELSTPVVKLWDGILALPMIGTLDSGRTQVVMESLLQRIVETGAEVAIIDITGVPTVDTLVAQHLIKTVTAARLMGADCIISGIRPQIAATIVHLGVDLTDIATKATLADAFKLALKRVGRSVERPENGKRPVNVKKT